MVMLEVVMVDMVMLVMLDMVGFGDAHGRVGGLRLVISMMEGPDCWIELLVKVCA